MPVYQIADLFAQRAKEIAPSTYGTELTKIITVSFAYGLADPNLFPHADLDCPELRPTRTATV
ncbi:hypothetical protein [Dendronalium sp. ChiSLP03b]|uniref:hypothetical protein n=1 Tax=Dendronalium sp. ChiSLP03b TaxID=3075381 RepID=UPI002AD3F5F7|nr:hypothetical protein [Dendronalium sp. ChiSLP03b]MDZ8203608.1 hypothetical protein [Dendronalium sp. ChiSLP03b]